MTTETTSPVVLVKLIPFWILSAMGGLMFGLGTCGLVGMVNLSLGVLMGALVSPIGVGFCVEWVFRRTLRLQPSSRVKLATILGFALIASGPAISLILLLVGGLCGAASPGCSELPYLSLACGLVGLVAGITLTLAAL